MITLKRNGKNPVALNIMISGVIAFLIFFSIISQIPEINLLILITILSLTIILFLSLLFLAQRRFLNIIKFSEIDSILEFESIYTTKMILKIEQIERISFLKSKGLKNKTNGFRNRNLSIKIKDKFQPQIFEIENISNNSKVIELIHQIIEEHDLLNVIYYKKKYQRKPDILRIEKDINNKTKTKLESILNNENIDLTIKVENVR